MTDATARPLVVVGSGVAGLTAALEAAEHTTGGRVTFAVTLVTKGVLEASNTTRAQGGVAVVTGPDDTIAEHVADTIAAGAGIVDREAAEVLCADGPSAVGDLITRGVAFDLVGDDLARGLEAAHGHARILHAGGDATGAAMTRALIARVRRSPVRILERTVVTDLELESGRVTGVRLLDGSVLTAEAVILATGGAGHLFAHTTNPEVATGDGIAMALRAGALVADAEFYQFHPTALDAPGDFLISEAVRGEGAVLRDADGRRFMVERHPDAELAPRDVVARGIAAVMARQPGLPVVLDATHLRGPDVEGCAAFLARRFPTIDRAVRALGHDWSRDPIPVTPAAHYWMGGVRTDRWGRTSLPGLLAVGEVACTGVHGANRLASNSLLEAAVYATRAVAHLASATPDDGVVGDPICDDLDPDELVADAVIPAEVDLADAPGAVPFERRDLQDAMWAAAGLHRDAAGLTELRKQLMGWRSPAVVDRRSAEDRNLLTVARALVSAALAREESRGAHHRTDFPHSSPAFAHHSAIVATVSGSVPALQEVSC
ncbi:L-aspartate oxidase [Janibacter sp. G56]|uniref:L-aspartate oxidase n=1 Tax=Janibacter sp. G56 TaxID=3418717 RepID=UPI003D040341